MSSGPAVVVVRHHCRGDRRRRGAHGVRGYRAVQRRYATRPLLVAAVQQFDILRGHLDRGASLAEKVVAGDRERAADFSQLLLELIVNVSEIGTKISSIKQENGIKKI